MVYRFNIDKMDDKPWIPYIQLVNTESINIKFKSFRSHAYFFLFKNSFIGS